MIRKYILNDAGEAVPVNDIIEWGAWLERADRRVAYDEVGPFQVSTVFLGIDHSFGDGPPLLFETMVFAGDGAEDAINRYTTRAEAIDGHRQMVEKYRAVLAAQESGRE